MEFILSLINVNLFLFLALLHFFWVVGGKWAFASAIPTDMNGRMVLKPGPLATFLVGLGLLFFALLNLSFIQLIQLPLEGVYVRYGMYIISIIFFLRFIGDIRYVGILRRYRQSRFAVLDTQIYTPTALFLSVTHALLPDLASYPDF